MTRKQLVHCVILLATIPMGELYQLLHTSELQERNWFLLSDRMQDIEWYLRDAGEKLSFIVLFAIWRHREKSGLFKKVLTAFLFYRIADMAMYWIDFDNTTRIYAAIYLLLGSYIAYYSLTSYLMTKCKHK